MIRPKRPKTIPHPTDPSLALVPLTKGYFALISAADIQAVGQRHWHVRVVEGSTPYASRAVRRPDGGITTESLHRFIGSQMGLSSDALVDHRNGNGLDCRRSNLRAASTNQNAWNSRRARNNTTGIKGVSRHRTRPHSPERYVARVMVGRKSVYLGTFDTIGEAAMAVAAARPALHGEFANGGDA
jgi:hypothetical protein